MKRLALCLVLLTGAALPGPAQTADSEFLQIYERIQQGDQREASKDLSAAYADYQAALEDLQRFSKAHPGWNEKIIRFRLDYLTGKVGGLKDQALPAAVPAVAPVAAPVPGAEPSGLADSLSIDLARERTRAEAAEVRASSAEARLSMALDKAADASARISELTDRAANLALDVRQFRDRVDVLEAAHRNLENHRERLESERTTLQAKLNEALGPKPAALDPAELARVQERNLMLAKENEILKASLDHQMAENQRVLEMARKSVEMEQELRAVRTELTAQRKQTEDLRDERTKLLARLETFQRKDTDSTASLRQEIEGLKKELANARISPKAAARDVDLASIRKEMEDQRAASDDLKRENAELLRELEKLTSIRVTPASLKVAELPQGEDAAAESLRLRRLERERDTLRSELEAAVTELRRRDASGGEKRVASLNSEVQRLEAKVRVLEAKPEPYSDEEKALFQAPAQRTQLPAAPKQLAQVEPPPTPGAAPKDSPPATPAPSPAPSPATAPAAKPVTTAAEAASKRRTAKDLPAGAGILASQAQRAFAQRRLDEAEKAYREILALDEKNVFTLGNLAAILVEQSRLKEADGLLQRALAVDGQDPFSLSLLGIIRFREQRYDEAFDALSRSAELDPESADTQNYLGITLSQRGQRPAAEAALRKALKLNPGSATAHYNLAVVYATQKPAYLELARYHYEKSRRAGQPANPAFEGVLRGEPATPATPEPAKQ